MIFLNREEQSVIKIDPDLVIDYKRESDLYLVNIKRSLTKQLVYYKVYYELNKVNNAFYAIIDGLLNEKYTKVQDFRNDVKDFSSAVNVFLRTCTDIIEEHVFDLVKADTDAVDLIIKKLVSIVENYCMKSEDLF